MHKASLLQCIHYADDTTLFSKGNNLDDLIDLTNIELVKINKSKREICLGGKSDVYKNHLGAC